MSETITPTATPAVLTWERINPLTEEARIFGVGFVRIEVCGDHHIIRATVFVGQDEEFPHATYFRLTADRKVGELDGPAKDIAARVLEATAA